MRSGPSREAGRASRAVVRSRLRVLIPGYPQWAWRQRERAVVYFGSFAAALAMGAFAWGTQLGTLMLAIAFGAHVASAADAVRQAAFPGFGWPVPWVSASAGLGMGVYAPILAVGTVLAWPGMRSDVPGEVYLVNRWAFEGDRPRVGTWVWYRGGDGSGHRVGRVVAGPGDRVEWTGRGLVVAGRPLGWAPPQSDGPPLELVLTPPPGRVLIAPLGDPPASASSCGLVSVSLDNVGGQAWARAYPIWRRHILP